MMASFHRSHQQCGAKTAGAEKRPGNPSAPTASVTSGGWPELVTGRREDKNTPHERLRNGVVLGKPLTVRRERGVFSLCGNRRFLGGELRKRWPISAATMESRMRESTYA